MGGPARGGRLTPLWRPEATCAFRQGVAVAAHGARCARRGAGRLRGRAGRAGFARVSRVVGPACAAGHQPSLAIGAWVVAGGRHCCPAGKRTWRARAARRPGGNRTRRARAALCRLASGAGIDRCLEIGPNRRATGHLSATVLCGASPAARRSGSAKHAARPIPSGHCDGDRRGDFRRRPPVRPRPDHARSSSRPNAAIRSIVSRTSLHSVWCDMMHSRSEYFPRSRVDEIMAVADSMMRAWIV
jgi:hypothetical protein